MVARRIGRKRKKMSIVGGCMLIYRFRLEVIQKDQPDVTVEVSKGAKIRNRYNQPLKYWPWIYQIFFCA